MRAKAATVLALLSLFVAWQGVVGADCYWLVAVGDWILKNGRLPDEVPFAVAPSAGWPNPLVLSQVWLAAVESRGVNVLLLAQIFSLVTALTLVSVDARRIGSGDAELAAVYVLLAFGGLASWAVVRLQLVSFIAFALLIMLLRQEHRVPSRKVWLLVPLVALWGNLHGAVVVGLAVIGCYLLFSRLRHSVSTAVGVGVASLLALNLNPAGTRTWLYYRGVFGNEAAQRGTELWARPSVDNPFDWMLVGSACALLALAVRARRPLWEYAVTAGLVIGTLLTARNGLWLLFFCAAPAAVGLTPPLKRHRPVVQRRGAPAVTLILLGALGGSALISAYRGTDVAPVPEAAVKAVVDLAGGQVLLAPEPAVESFAADGARVWMANPIDAFQQGDQAAYLDFLSGGPLAHKALASADIVVVRRGSDLAQRLAATSQLLPVPGAPEWLYFRTARS